MIDSMTRTRPAAAEQDAHRRLGQHLLDVVRRQDAAIPAERRAPRTVAQMRDRLAQAGVTAVVHDDDGDDVCGLCGCWTCSCPKGAAPAVQPAARQTAARGQRACGTCQGTGGRTVDYSEKGVTRQQWVRCGTCKGTGAA